MYAKIELQERAYDSRMRSVLAPALAVSLLVTVLLFVLAPPASAAVSTTADADNVQTDGRVSAILTVGDTTYLGGTFNHVNGTARANLAAIDATTGQLTDWAPKANGSVAALAASSDGGRIYAGGSFTEVSGNKRGHLAAISAATGKVNGAWKPRTDYVVRALAVSGNRVYLGGSFTQVNGKSRARLARVNATTGSLSSRWAPKADGAVYSLALSSDTKRLYAGGAFTNIGNAPRPYLAALNPTTGTPLASWQPTPQPNGSPVWDIQEEGELMYAAEGGLGGAVAAYESSTGARAWRLWTDGDVQALAVSGGKVYFGGHFGTVGGESGVYTGRVARRYMAAVEKASGEVDPWAPSGADAQVWAMAGDASRSRLLVGGDFTTVSGEPHRGFAQFSG